MIFTELWRPKDQDNFKIESMLIFAFSIAFILMFIGMLRNFTAIKQQVDAYYLLYQDESLLNTILHYFTEYHTSPIVILFIKLKTIFFHNHWLLWLLSRWISFAIFIFIMLFCCNYYYHRLWALVTTILCCSNGFLMSAVLDFGATEFQFIYGAMLFLCGFTILFLNKDNGVATDNMRRFRYLDVLGWSSIFIGSFIYLGAQTYAFLMLPLYIFSYVVLRKHRGFCSDFGSCVNVVVIIFHLYSAFLVMFFAPIGTGLINLNMSWWERVKNIAWSSHLDNFTFCWLLIFASIVMFRHHIRVSSRKRLTASLIVNIYLYLIFTISLMWQTNGHLIGNYFTFNFMTLRFLGISSIYILWRDVCKSDRNIEAIILWSVALFSCYNLFYL